MKKMITDTIDLDELNGATIGTWINTLHELQDEVGKSAIIFAYAYNDIGCTLEISYERLETDKEESERLVNEDLKIKNVKNFAADHGVTIKEVNFL
jgi:hypothetical protein